MERTTFIVLMRWLAPLALLGLYVSVGIPMITLGGLHSAVIGAVLGLFGVAGTSLSLFRKLDSVYSDVYDTLCIFFTFG